jgi:DNA-binding NarL/FixJ family response regulator
MLMYCLKDDKLLTKRELEVLVCLYKGYTNPKIADRLCITISTVKAHISNILRKMGAERRIDILLMLVGEKNIKNKDIKKQISYLVYKK